jgi:hypothetical protein
VILIRTVSLDVHERWRQKSSYEKSTRSLQDAKGAKEEAAREMGELKSTMANQEQLVKARNWFKRRTLRTGGKFIKYSTEGKPQDRSMWVSQDLTKLCWARFKNSLVSSQPSVVAIDEITKVSCWNSRHLL